MIDSITNTIIDSIPVGNYPAYVAYNPSNNNMYVTNHFSDIISVIHSTANSVIDTIPAGVGPAGIIYDSSNQHLYVTNMGSNTVTMIHP